MAATDDLKEHLDAIVSDVLVADKCYFLLKGISDTAQPINDNNYGQLFSCLQDGLVSVYTLTLGRLFELPKRYKIRGIPALLESLEENRESIPLPSENRKWMVEELGVTGLEELSDADFTRSVVEVLRNICPARKPRRSSIPWMGSGSAATRPWRIRRSSVDIKAGN